MRQSALEAGIPERLIDPQTGRILFCAEAVALMIERLDHSDYDDLRRALRGFESIFDKLFRNLNFSGASFMAQDLRGMDFSGAAFRGCAFDHAMIEEAGFRGALVDRAALIKSGDWPQAVARACRAAMEHQGTNRRLPALQAPLFESWAPFSESHHLPEFVMLPSDLAVEDLAGDLRAALRARRLAIGRYPVLRIELACMSEAGTLESRWKNAIGKHATEEHRAWLGPCRTTLAELRDYVDFLNAQARSDHRLVPFELLGAVQQAAQRAGAATLCSERQREFATNRDGSIEIRGPDGSRRGYNPAVVQTKACFRVLRVFTE